MRPGIEDIPLSKFDLSLSGMRIMNMTRVLQVEKSMRLHRFRPIWLESKFSLSYENKKSRICR